MNLDLVELNKRKVPLADLRMLIVELMKDGIKEAPLGDLLLMIRSLLQKIDAE